MPVDEQRKTLNAKLRARYRYYRRCTNSRVFTTHGCDLGSAARPHGGESRLSSRKSGGGGLSGRSLTKVEWQPKRMRS